MIWKFTLSHEVLGEKEISDPIGWLESKLTLERHADFASLIEYFTGDFVFYGSDGDVDGGIDFIRQVESTYGVDAYLGIKIELAPDNYTYETVFEGQLDLSTITEMQDNKAQVAIIRDDFWAKFINRYDTQVNVQSSEDLDGEAISITENVVLKATPQKVRQQHRATNELDTTIAYSIPNNDYGQLDLSVIELQEIDDYYTLLNEENSDEPLSNFLVMYAGDYAFDIEVNTTTSVILGGDPTDPDLDLILNVDGVETTLTKTNAGVPGLDGHTIHTYIGTQVLNEASSIKLYFRNNTGGSYNFVVPGAILYESHLYIVADTTYPESLIEGFLVHDLGGSITDRIIGQDDSFYSEYLGSTETKYRTYDSDGCGSNLLTAQGSQVRGYKLSERQYSLSMKKWWEGINPSHNLSLMYDTIDGELVIRVEEKEHCFEDGDTSIDIPFVRQISRKYDADQLLRTVKIGNKKWESDNIAGLDIPQTKHTYATQLKRTGRDLTIESEFIAADITWETTRRTKRVKSADFKYDNDTFIVLINPNKVETSPDLSPDRDAYEPELNDVTAVTGLINEDTRYNKSLTPGRAMLRWLKFISGTVYQYAGSLFKFTYGEGNYDMQATAVNACEPAPATLSERQDIIADPDPVYLPFEYEFTNVPLDYSDYVTIRDNRKNPIGISQTDEGFTKFYIKKLVYDQVQGLATINAWPKTFMDILVIEGDFSKEPCTPSEIPDGCYRITEDGLYRVTESGEFRILEDC